MTEIVDAYRGDRHTKIDYGQTDVNCSISISIRQSVICILCKVVSIPAHYLNNVTYKCMSGIFNTLNQKYAANILCFKSFNQNYISIISCGGSYSNLFPTLSRHLSKF